jgi:hypothetical protein
MTGTAAVTQPADTQTSPAPQAVPSAFGSPSTQRPGAVEDVHAVAPSRHGFAGWHGAFGMHAAATHEPPLHTLPPPQAVPSGLLLVTTQLGSAIGVAQAVVPVVHGFSGWQTWFDAHVGATQAPAWHTLDAPQAVPSGRSPASTQTGAPLAQPTLPWPHGFATAHAAPSVQPPSGGSSLPEPPQPPAIPASNNATAAIRERRIEAPPGWIPGG